MVVGSGLLAQAHQQYFDNDPNVIIFASGVSDSKTADSTQYDREKNLIQSFLNPKRFIYFSTCSIYDTSLASSAYIQHKLRIEQFIKDNFPSYLIIRLPNVIGGIGNPNTMFNYFINKIRLREPIQIQKNASRYTIDVEDVAYFTQKLVLAEIQNQTIDVALPNRLPVLEIVEICEQFTKIPANKTLIEGGNTYLINDVVFRTLSETWNLPPITPRAYIENLLHKYYTPT